MKRYVKSSRSRYSEIKKAEEEWKRGFAAREQLYLSQVKNYNKALSSYVSLINSKLKEKFRYFLDNMPGLTIKDGGYEVETRIFIIYKAPIGENDTLNVSYNIVMGRSVENPFTQKKPSLKSHVSSTTDVDLIDNAHELNKIYELTKFIAEFDWESFLDEADRYRPRERQYIAIKDPRWDKDYAKPDFGAQYFEDVINSYAGKDIWIETTSQEFIHFFSIDDEGVTEPENHIAYVRIDPYFDWEKSLNMLSTSNYSGRIEIEDLIDFYRNRNFDLVQPLNAITTDELIELINRYKDED